MSSTVLVINAGSSSIKYQLLGDDEPILLCRGLAERIGEEGSRLQHTCNGTTTERVAPLADHSAAMDEIFATFDDVGPDLATSDLVAVGHRVVMGGRDIDAPVIVTDGIVATIERLSPLAPLHNPPSVAAMRAARRRLAHTPHVAVFDTAFFHDLPIAAATYALDRDVAQQFAIRRYGFHGISHQYVSAKAVEVLGGGVLGGDAAEYRQIVLHLGNGASASAIVGGKPIDTSMGLTPLEGLVMGTRAGDIDAAVVFHLSRVAGMSIDDIDQLLNQRSGLMGLTGTNDMRDVHRLVAAGQPSATLALEIYVRRLKKYIGAYTALMGGLDVLTFTAGVGEHDPIVRAAVADGLQVLDVRIDPARNAAASDAPRVISPDGARVSVLVVPTNEELAIARQARSIV